MGDRALGVINQKRLVTVCGQGRLQTYRNHQSEYKVPGNFHISIHAYHDKIHGLAGNKIDYWLFS
jgi:hypothetical protein